MLVHLPYIVPSPAPHHYQLLQSVCNSLQFFCPSFTEACPGHPHASSLSQTHLAKNLRVQSPIPLCRVSTPNFHIQNASKIQSAPVAADTTGGKLHPWKLDFPHKITISAVQNHFQALGTSCIGRAYTVLELSLGLHPLRHLIHKCCQM